MTNNYPALKLVQTLEERIKTMRNCPNRCPVVDTLDERIDRQRRLVEGLLQKFGLTVDQLMSISIRDIKTKDIELQLWYHVLRDCDYIDGLR